MREQGAKRRPEQVGAGKNQAGSRHDEQQNEEKGNADARRRIMPDILLGIAGEECRSIAAQCAPISRPTRQNGAPACVTIAEECPNDAPQQIENEDVPESHMYLLKKDFSVC